MFRFENFLESLRSGLYYLPDTLLLIAVPLLLGIVFGTVIALIRVYKVPVLEKVLSAAITVYQGVPVVVALMIYNLLFNLKFNDIASFFHLSVTIRDVSTVWVGVFALTLIAIPMISDVIRGALLSVEPGQSEAAWSAGLTRVQTIRRIVIPQMIPVAIPGLVNSIIILIKSSSIMMTAGICEVLMGSTLPSMRTYTYFEGYLAAALIYWGLAIIVEAAARFAQKRSGRFKKIVN